MPHFREFEDVICDAFLEILFIWDSKSTKFTFISKY